MQKPPPPATRRPQEEARRPKSRPPGHRRSAALAGFSAFPVLASFAFLAVALALGIAFGTERTSLIRALTEPASLDRVLVARARAPRVALGAVAGAGLSVVGVAFQALLRNPLAEPYVLGVSGGAALGATTTLLLGASGVTILGASLLPLAAFAGGILATALVYGLARAGDPTRPSGTTILLAGVVVNAVASAAITFTKTLVAAQKAQEILFWLAGFLDVPAASSLAFATLYVVLGSLVLLRDAGRLNLLALGDEAAAHLGVDVRALERRTFVACSLIVGAIVSLTGLIGFVGLVVPHALRRLFGPDARVLLPAAFFAGGGTLVLCDLVGRLLFRALGSEPPVGAVTAVAFGPIFLLVLRRRAL